MSAIQINDDLEQNKITCEIALDRCNEEHVIITNRSKCVY